MSQQLIDKILKATNYSQVLDYRENWGSELRHYLQWIHPDHNGNNGQATEACAKLLAYRDIMVNGIKGIDDSGEYLYFPQHIRYFGDNTLLKQSINKWIEICTKSGDILRQYLPTKYEYGQYLPMIHDNNKTYCYATFPYRAIPISKIDSLPQEHLNWVLNRMLEFSTMLNNIGWSHNGINPDSIFLVPETHGIIVSSLYHALPLGRQIKTISAKYKNFYPQSIFRKDIELPAHTIDIELAKRTVIYLAGDKSGVGTKLRGKLNKEWLDFVLNFSTESAYTTYMKYRDLLKRNFESKFYICNI
jgi:hypothetical protein